MDILILLVAISMLLAFERMPSLRFERLPVLRRYVGTDFLYLLTSGIGLSLIVRQLASRLLSPADSYSSTAALVFGSLVLFDLGAYISHRLLHRFNFLWEIHKVHHSSRTLDWLATFRGHILEHVVRQLFSPVLLIVLGVPLAVVGLTGAIHGAWSAFVHSNLAPRLRFVDFLFITPRLHRVHHVSKSCELNFGVLFSIWDRLGGTLLTDTNAKPGRLGVPDEEDTYPQTWATQLLEPVRRWRGFAATGMGHRDRSYCET